MAAHEQGHGKSDEWYTPPYIFDALGETFDMDVAAPWDRTYCRVPAAKHIAERSLETKWEGFVWMNPPFGGRNALLPWLSRFFRHGSGIALTPDRTSAPWWQFSAERARTVLFLAPKVQFIKPDGLLGKSPGTGTCLWACCDRSVAALDRAAVALGTVAKLA